MNVPLLSMINENEVLGAGFSSSTSAQACVSPSVLHGGPLSQESRSCWSGDREKEEQQNSPKNQEIIFLRQERISN